MTRIAIVTSSYPASADDPSGHFVATAAKNLCGVGREIYVLCPDNGRRPDRVAREAGCDVMVVGCGGGSLFGWPGALPRLRSNPARLVWLGDFAWRVGRELRWLGPDRVVAHWWLPCGYLAAGAGELEIVAHGSDVRLLERLPPALRNRVLDATRHARRVTFSSERLRDGLLSKLDGERRRWLERVSEVSVPPIDVPVLSAAPSGRWVAVGRLVEEKRFDRVLDALQLVDAELVVVGDGPDRDRLRAQAATLGGRVRFAGQLPRDACLGEIARAGVLVHASEHEGAPTVIREARMLGCPVVACASGDVMRWAQGDPGIVVSEPSPQAIAEAARIAVELPRRPVADPARERQGLQS